MSSCGLCSKDPVSIALDSLAQLAHLIGCSARIVYMHDRWFVSVGRYLGISELDGELVDAVARCLAMAQLTFKHRFFNVVHEIHGRPIIVTRIVQGAR